MARVSGAVNALGSHLRFMATVFVDAESIVANSRDITALMNAYADETFLPIPVQEATAGGLIRRVGFQTADESYRLILGSRRFDFMQLSDDPNGSDLGDFADFCRNAAGKLGAALDHYQRRPHRLAAVQEGFLSPLAGEAMDRIGKRLLATPATYKQNPLNEWDWRCVTRIERRFGDTSEPVNTITVIKRIPGTVFASPTSLPPESVPDRIRVDLDLNTLPTTANARFGNQEVHAFLEAAPTWHKELLQELLSFMHARNVRG